MLHIVNKSPTENTTLASCLKIARGGHDSLLLTEDAVYAATSGTQAAEQIRAALADVKVYALWPDVEARGIQDRIVDGVKMVDYAGFVDLVVECDNVQSWL